MSASVISAIPWAIQSLPPKTYSNAQGLSTLVKAPYNTRTRFTYNPLGELLNSRAPEDNITSYQYDMLGRRTERVHPDAGTTTWQYDKAGNLISMQTANLGQVSEYITYGYSYNRLGDVVFPLNTYNNVSYTYGDNGSGNQAGRITAQLDATGLQEFEYGLLGEMTRCTRYLVIPGDNYFTFQTAWEYDSWNRIEKITYPDREQVSYFYNLGGLLDSMHSTKGDSWQTDIVDAIGYDEFERRNYIHLGNGTKTRYFYNDTRGFLSWMYSLNSNNEGMQDITYAYDATGNITSIDNTANQLSNGIGGWNSYSFEYDSLYRLVGLIGLLEQRD